MAIFLRMKLCMVVWRLYIPVHSNSLPNFLTDAYLIPQTPGLGRGGGGGGGAGIS